MYAKTSTAISLISLIFVAYLATGFASSHITEKQLEAMAKQVGKTYWVAAEESKRPFFFSAPSPFSSSFRAESKETFSITEIVEGSTQRPYYYKVRFSSGREGYISVDSFLEEFNSTLVTQDPERGQKRKSAKEAKEGSKREDQIGAKPWPEHVKEAALKRQAVLGMNRSEVKGALGKPTRVVKLKQTNPLIGEQEQWIYEKGPILTFTNGVVTRMQTLEARAE